MSMEGDTVGTTPSRQYFPLVKNLSGSSKKIIGVFRNRYYSYKYTYLSFPPGPIFSRQLCLCITVECYRYDRLICAGGLSSQLFVAEGPDLGEKETNSSRARPENERK